MNNEQRVNELIGDYTARSSSTSKETVPFTITGFNRWKPEFPVIGHTYEGRRNGRPIVPVHGNWSLESIEEMLRTGILKPKAKGEPQ